MSAPTTIRSVNVPNWSTAIDVGIRRTTTAELPPAESSAVMLSRALVEVLSGRRLLGQLRIHCSPDIYDALPGGCRPRRRHYPTWSVCSSANRPTASQRSALSSSARTGSARWPFDSKASTVGGGSSPWNWADLRPAAGPFSTRSLAIPTTPAAVRSMRGNPGGDRHAEGEQRRR